MHFVPASPQLARISAVSVAFAATLACAAAWAHDAADSAAQRRAIAEQRSRVQAEHAARVSECQTRFVVTSCIEDADRRNREALADLRRQDKAIDDEQRRLRGAQRIRQIESRAARRATEPAAASPVQRDGQQPSALDAPAGNPAAPSAAPSAAPERVARPAPRPQAMPGAERAERAERADPATRQRQMREAAAQRRQQAERRQREAEERKAKALERQAGKASRPAVRPLPAPN